MNIIYSSKFAREYKKLPRNVKQIAEEQEALFRENPFDSKLKTHRLQGKLSGFLSFSVGYKNRIIFEFAKDKNTVYFHSVRDHDIYE